MGRVKDELYIEHDYDEDFLWPYPRTRTRTGTEPDMNISEMTQSNYLKKEDCIPDKLVTIGGLEHKNVAQTGEPPEMKFCLHLNEFDKPLVLNQTNIQLIAMVTGSPETNDWIGKRIVLWNDPSVSYGGQITGGIRVRAPRNQPQQPAQPTPARDALQQPVNATPVGQNFDDDIPF